MDGGTALAGLVGAHRIRSVLVGLRMAAVPSGPAQREIDRLEAHVRIALVYAEPVTGRTVHLATTGLDAGWLRPSALASLIEDCRPGDDLGPVSAWLEALSTVAGDRPA